MVCSRIDHAVCRLSNLREILLLINSANYFLFYSIKTSYSVAANYKCTTLLFGIIVTYSMPTWELRPRNYFQLQTRARQKVDSKDIHVGI